MFVWWRSPFPFRFSKKAELIPLSHIGKESGTERVLLANQRIRSNETQGKVENFPSFNQAIILHLLGKT